MYYKLYIFVQYEITTFKLYIMIPRKLESELRLLIKEFPIVAIMGPRQSGKTTLSRHLFKDYKYISLEDPDIRAIATDDPKGFLHNLGQRFILDEIQHVPELFSYLQKIADEKRVMGEIIITGSQNYLLSAKISQSLSGRVGISILLPFSFNELYRDNVEAVKAVSYILKGSYPPVYDRKIRPESFYASYVATYIERDVRRILNIKNSAVFNKFLRLLAGRTGQLINKNELAAQAGISHISVENWLSVLEQSFIIFRLQPYYKNLVKRQTKQAKLYFYDSGLAAWLAGIKSEKELDIHYLNGALFENMIISELAKHLVSTNNSAAFYFWRNHHNYEVDLIIDRGEEVELLEIKSSATFRTDFVKTILNTENKFHSKTVKKSLIYRGDTELEYKGVGIYPWKNYLLSIIGER